MIRPEHRANKAVADALLGTLAAEVAAHGGGRVVLWVMGADSPADALAARNGFARIREQLEMGVKLPIAESPRWPDGTTVRAFVPGADDEAWLRVNNRAFGNHPEQGGWIEATLRRRLAEPWFDVAGFLLAFDASGLAGFCWTKVHEAADPADRLGEIFVIGVDPDRQATGLGRALVVAGLQYLATARACPNGLLYVDAANTPARALYRSLGFAARRTDRSYEREVRAA